MPHGARLAGSVVLITVEHADLDEPHYCETVVCGDVLDIPPPASAADRFDVICANNYSHQCLKDRDAMLCYLTKCRTSLAEGGIFVMDLCGVRENPCAVSAIP